jgi:uncharacterized protein
MNRYKTVFTNRHTVLPVIHVETFEQTLRNVQIAHEEDCDGVFLINHSIDHGDLLGIYGEIRSRFPEWWIGVNCLGLLPQDVFRHVNADVSGIWVDNAMIDERTEIQDNAARIQSARIESGFTGLYFGGIAFKYQRQVEDLERSAQISRTYLDIVTTSGSGTGRSAPPEKIMTMKRALGDCPLAIASGITPKNVRSYLDHTDCFLVATGISKNWTELYGPLVRELVTTVRSYELPLQK